MSRECCDCGSRLDGVAGCDDFGHLLCVDCLDDRATQREARELRALNSQAHYPLHDASACAQCVEQAAGAMGPSHVGSIACDSGALAAGGRNAHCTCDMCW